MVLYGTTCSNHGGGLCAVLLETGDGESKRAGAELARESGWVDLDVSVVLVYVACLRE